MAAARTFRAILAGMLPLLPAAAGAQTTPCTEVYGSILAGALPVQGLSWPQLAHPGLLYDGADAVQSRACLGGGSAPDSASAPLRLLPVRLDAGYRSAYPLDRNNGSIWSGRGLTQAVSAGFVVRAGPARLTVYPTVAFQENREFETAALGYRYPYGDLDWPQRFGSGSYWTIDPGQTSLALELGPVLASAGTENLWWGPATRYPILLSSTAPGFPHLRLGTSRPLWMGIGWLEGGVLWGSMRESDHYDADATNDRRLMTMAMVGYRPSFLPGFALGLNLAQHHEPSAGWKGAGDVLLGSGTANTPTNGLASIVADWRMADAGVRLYAEWARDDFFLNVEDLLTEIDHSQGYLLGFERTLGGGEPWRVRAELTRLSRTNSRSHRSGATFYEHNVIVQGHTNGGQILGSAIGPGSNAQYLSVDRTGPRMLVGGYLERIRHNDDAYEDRFASTYGFRGHDLELIGGLFGIGRIGQIELDWDVSASRRKNRDFIGLDRVNWDFRREWNLGLELAATWLPRL